MIKIFVDSGSSIKKEERRFYDVEVLPLQILLKDREYLDGENLPMDAFYRALLDEKVFPKTSLPLLDEAEQRVNRCVKEGYDVIILTLSSGISGTYNALYTLFQGNLKVRVIDSKTAVGGMKILVREANKYRNETLDFVEEKLNALIPRIKVLAVPETLEYLHKGGRLSKASWVVGTLLKIKPIIELKHTVKVAGKSIGLKSAMKYIVSALENCDTEYPIVPSYTYSTKNLDEMIAKTNQKYQEVMTEKDDLDPAIAAHWGPNAFGYIFVEK
ncbi:MAG: DegV family protein [Clostridia bacterium]|nr:DegV family protein [Clostridia bacterium]